MAEEDDFIDARKNYSRMYPDAGYGRAGVKLSAKKSIETRNGAVFWRGCRRTFLKQENAGLLNYIQCWESLACIHKTSNNVVEGSLYLSLIFQVHSQ